MTNKLAIILVAGALAAPALTQAEGHKGQKQGSHGLNKQRGHGAPNSVRTQSGSKHGSANRQTIRQPLGSANQKRHEGKGNKAEQGGQKGGNHQKGGQKGSGMSRTEKGGNHQKQKAKIKDALDLTDEQAAKLKAIHEQWHKDAKAIHTNKELSKEEKHAQLKELFKKMDAQVREVLSEEQYAKLKKIRQTAARPKQGGNEENGSKISNRAQRRQRIAKELGLTEEQIKKLRAIHYYAVKKIKGILANKELSKEQKQKAIRTVHYHAHKRRMEVLTAEQKEKLKKIKAHIRAKRQEQANKGGGNSSGKPEPRGEQEQHNKTSSKGGHKKQGGGLGAKQNEQNGSHSKVILYCAPGCGYCTKAANLLKEKGIDFVRKNIRADGKARAEVAEKTKEAGINWRGGVPVIDAKGKIIVGYNKSALSRIK